MKVFVLLLYFAALSARSRLCLAKIDRRFHKPIFIISKIMAAVMLAAGWIWIVLFPYETTFLFMGIYFSNIAKAICKL